MRICTAVAALIAQAFAQHDEFCGKATLTDHSLLQNLQIQKNQVLQAVGEQQTTSVEQCWSLVDSDSWCGQSNRDQGYSIGENAGIVHWRLDTRRNGGWSWCGVSTEECQHACETLGGCAEIFHAPNSCCFPSRSVCDTGSDIPGGRGGTRHVLQDCVIDDPPPTTTTTTTTKTVELVSPVKQYGHAFQVPRDFTTAEIQDIAGRFPLFTVEKRHAYRVYGNRRLAAPYNYNSIRATNETAGKIKAVNPAAKALMYWNSAIHYNMYECEADVQDSWLLPVARYQRNRRWYNVSVPELRSWWSNCAINAIRDSNGLIDGLFLDALPKIQQRQGLQGVDHWKSMVQAIKTGLPDAMIINNGFYMPSGGGEETKVASITAGTEVFGSTDGVYIESFSRAVTSRLTTTVKEYLSAVQQAFATGDQMMLGHHDTGDGPFSYVYGCFLMVIPQASPAYFLSNNGYRISQGMLTEHAEYNMALGVPTEEHFTINGNVLTREFEGGAVSVNLESRIASFP